MPAPEAGALLSAIREFLSAYGGEERYASVLEHLQAAEDALDGESESDTPGRREARQASEEQDARAPVERQESPGRREARDAARQSFPPSKREEEPEEKPPRDMREARERSRKRFRKSY